MGTEPTATGWTTTGVSTSSAATTPSLTGDDVAVYVRRGSATMTQAMALESAIESTIDSSKALSIAVDTGLNSSLGVEIRTALTFASHRNRASALRRAAALVRSLPGRALGDPATNLAEKLTETDLLIHSGPTDLSDYAGVLARTGLLASDLGAAEFAATSTPPYSALYRQVGIVIYGLVALALVPVSAAPAGDREGLNDDLTAERRLRSAGIVADPRQEESRSFELVWSIIQRAIDTHAIAPTSRPIYIC